MVRPVAGQQVPDPAFDPPITSREFAEGKGPLVLVDAAHNNFHTADGRYAAFATLLRRDGYVVQKSDRNLSTAVLADAGVLVIANAIADANIEDWSLPTPSAFTPAEVSALSAWVRGGGSLLLIADHMPVAGNTAALAAAFGVRFYNGFALDRTGGGTFVFSRRSRTLKPHPITDGRYGERVDSVAAFTGQAFRVDPGIDASPLLVLPEEASVVLPADADNWVYSDTLPSVPGAYLLQGVVVRHGRGRVAVFGEASMFSAQLNGPDRRPMGMNRPEAQQNYLFVLSVMHWLTREGA